MAGTVLQRYHHDAFFELAAPARQPSRDVEQPRPPQQRGGHLFHLPDRRRVPGVVAAATLGIPGSAAPADRPVAATAAGFSFLYRIPFDTPSAWRRERASVFLTDIGLVALFTTLVLLLGAGPVALVQLPTIMIAAILGVWLFSVQHRFETVLWLRQKDWTATSAALFGSSHLRLPRILQWFSGNIGFHHIHHLLPRVPNYRLEECHNACASLVPGTPSLTLGRRCRPPPTRCGTRRRSGWCGSPTCGPAPGDTHRRRQARRRDIVQPKSSASAARTGSGSTAMWL